MNSEQQVKWLVFEMLGWTLNLQPVAWPYGQPVNKEEKNTHTASGDTKDLNVTFSSPQVFVIINIPCYST